VGLEESTHTMETTICDVLCKLNGDQNPNLDVKQRLNRLAPLPCVVLDAGHVLLHASNSFNSVSSVEEPRARWFVRQEEVDGCGPHYSECAE
jgi:hypothetical protein